MQPLRPSRRQLYQDILNNITNYVLFKVDNILPHVVVNGIAGDLHFSTYHIAFADMSDQYGRGWIIIFDDDHYNIKKQYIVRHVSEVYDIIDYLFTNYIGPPPDADDEEEYDD